jgi:hypothetical protein
MRPAIMIICQTLATLGFGVNMLLAYIILKIPNGEKIVAELFEYTNAPVMMIMVMTAITFMGTLLLTMGNVQSMTWKESYLESRKQISS